MEALVEPLLSLGFMQRGLLAGLIAGLPCGVIGVWVVLRRVVFLGDALGHGVVPGVAVAYLVGAALPVGAAASAVVMVIGISVVTRLRRLREDAAIGLCLVGMLACGVLIISRSGSFAVDVSHILFGNPLGVTPGDLVVTAVCAGTILVASLIGHRAFLVLTFDPRKAEVLGLRPKVAQGVLLALVALTVVASFQAVGALLVFALLVAPAAAAVLIARKVVTAMILAVILAWSAVVVGLLASYHARLATGAAIAVIAVAQFLVAAAGVALRRLVSRVRVSSSNWE